METKITIWLCSFKRASFFVRFEWPFLRPGLRTEGRCAQGLSRRAFRPPRSGLVLMAPSTAPCLRRTGHSQLRRRFPGSWKINRRSARTQFCSCQRSRYLPRSFKVHLDGRNLMPALEGEASRVSAYENSKGESTMTAASRSHAPAPLICAHSEQGFTAVLRYWLGGDLSWRHPHTMRDISHETSKTRRAFC